MLLWPNEGSKEGKTEVVDTRVNKIYSGIVKIAFVKGSNAF